MFSFAQVSIRTFVTDYALEFRLDSQKTVWMDFPEWFALEYLVAIIGEHQKVLWGIV